MKTLITLCLILLGSYCIAGTIDPINNDKDYLDYGDKHECVVKLNCIDAKYGYGSAVLISPKIAVTAAHMVVDVKKAYISHNDKNIDIITIVCHKDFIDDTNNKKMSSNDIAICKLKEPINLDYYPSLYTDKDEVGKICSICGFGLSGTYDMGASKADAKKRAGSNIIDEITSGMLSCSVHSGKKTSLEFLISHGDSGGGLFIDKKLAGINSLIFTESADKNFNSDFRDFSCHTRISSHVEWIKEVIEILE